MKTALVTGATGRIGVHIAGALADLGWRVLVTGRDPARGEKAVEALRARGARSLELLLGDGALIARTSASPKKSPAAWTAWTSS